MKDLKGTEMFVVLEDVMTAPARNIQEKKIDNITFVEFDTCLQSFEVRNRNKRKYLKHFMLPSFDSPHIAELESKGGWMGEAGHPITDDTRRIMTIDPKMVSHKITKHWLEGNLAYGHIQTLADVYGPQMTRLILQGMEPSFSLRALAPMKNDPQGGKIQNGKAFIICYDWVFYPSHIEAYRDTRSEIKKVNMAVTESANSMICNSKDLIVTESSIIAFVKEESKNIKLVSSMFEV
ncbi:MAG: hypothetical protein RR192_03655, partial [Peptostreptococcaceae bacterium]